MEALFHKAFCDDDAAAVRRLLDQYPQARAGIRSMPVVTHARSRTMLDVLLDAGADINAKSNWWAGGFGLLHSAAPDLAAYAIERGAVVDAHAAARLGRFDRLRELVEADPSLVHQRGGDGQTPLHFAATVEIAEYLLGRGAKIDARDVDHESTPAQHMLGDRQEVARFLVGRGCWTDLLMASALGDAALVGRLLDADPGCIRRRVNDEWFPKASPKSGGTIYQWTLGWHVSAHEVAKQFGHEATYQLLMERSPAEVRLIVHGWTGDEEAAKTLLAANPGLVARLAETDRRQVAHAARNNNTEAVRLMLSIGLPVAAVSQHQGSPLHWAAWHGNDAMTRDILRHHPPLELTDADFRATPLGWAMHGSENGWPSRTGHYAETVQLLLDAGAKIPKDRTDGTEAVKAALHAFTTRHAR